MKKDIILLSTLLVSLAGFCQEPDKNYTKSTQYKVATTSGSVSPEEKVTTATYYDGLGRPIQQIAQGQSAYGTNIITHMEYDSFGRMQKEFLPHESSGTSLDFSTSAAADAASHYESSYPFSEKFFENSPLDRVVKQAAPGEPWAGNPNDDNDHTVKFVYETNVEDEVRLYKFTVTQNTEGVYIPSNPAGNDFYAPNQLYKTITRDENWVSGKNHTTEEFKDKQGRVVLKRTFDSSEPHDTYYVYDGYGNLTFVIPPSAVKESPALGLCYQYRYDARNRLVEKKLPDRDWEYIVYDALDRVRLTGPVYHPSGNGHLVWLFNKHDEFNRILYTGWYNGSGTRAQLQALVSPSELHENRLSPYTPASDPGVTLIYSDKVFPKNNYNVLTINYYDDYDFPGAPTSFPTTILGSSDYGTYYTNTIKPKGMPTGSWVRVLSADDPVVGETTYILYDKKQRPVRTHKENYLHGFTNTDVLYDFNKQLQTETTHSRISQTTNLTVSNFFEYTLEDRIQKHLHRIDNLDDHVLADNSYEPLGKIKAKRVGGINNVDPPYQVVDFGYNIRNWLVYINNPNKAVGDDLFAFKINYEAVADDLSGEVTELYNGNISETFWRSATDDIQRKYGYKYDALNRLKKAFYQKPGMIPSYAGGYDEELSYDANGNITQINRNGHVDAIYAPHEIDDLHFSYAPNSNQLMRVFDGSFDPNGFKDEDGLGGTADSDDDYEYDSFGNLMRDQNKQIDSISYNHLNLPVKIVFANQDEINYLYDATGVKVQKSVTAGSTTNTTDYLGEFQYYDNSLNFIHHAEGYVKCTNMGQYMAYNYVYQYKDHLGNIRMNYAKNPQTGVLEIVDENHYYPFGLKHTNYNVDEKDFVKEDEILELKVPPIKTAPYQYKYQEQERQDELGLNWDSFRFRNYDYAIGRFMTIDPLAEKYPSWAPYVFSGNRVIDARELEGLEPYVLFNSKDAAANNFSKLYNSRSIVDNREYVTKIYETTDLYGKIVYAYAQPVQGGPAGATPSSVTIPNGTTYAAVAHTHGAYDARYLNDDFSGIIGDPKSQGDMGYAERHNMDIYVATPNGSFQKYDFTKNKIIPLSTDMPSDPKHPNRLNKIDPLVPINITPAPVVPITPSVPTVTPIPIPTPAPAPLPAPKPKPIIIPTPSFKP